MAAETGQLIVQFEGQIIQTVPLTQAPITLGRAPEVDLTLPHPRVSRAHAEVRATPQGVILTDLGSANGTFFGEERLQPNQPRTLTAGMSFRVGPYEITYHTAQPSQSTQPTSSLEDEQASKPQRSVYAVEATSTLKMAPLSAPQALPPVQRPPHPASESIYSHFLPDLFQENDFLQRFLQIFEDIWEPLEQRQDHIELYFDPRTCPASFLPWLASWLGLSFNAHWPEARRRRLLTQAIDLYKWRGTPYGLTRMLEVCTGLIPTITENPLEPFVFRISITLPPEASDHAVDRNLIEDLIQLHKPAHAGYILEIH